MSGRPIDQGQPYRLLWWVVLGSLTGNVLQGFLLAVAVAAVAQLAGRVDVKPFFVTADLAQNRVFHVEPMYGDVKTYDLVTQTLARQYVVLRETIDHKTESERWRRASWLASEKVSEAFAAIMKAKDSPLEKFRLAERTRAIRIISSPMILSSGDQRTFTIEFEQTDKRRDVVVEQRQFVATVVMDKSAADVRYEDALLNPYGSVVVHYDVGVKEN